MPILEEHDPAGAVERQGWFFAHDVFDPVTDKPIFRRNDRVDEEATGRLSARGVEHLYLTPAPLDAVALETNDYRRAHRKTEIQRSRLRLKHTFSLMANQVMNQVQFDKPVDISASMLARIHRAVEGLVATIARDPRTALYLDLLDSDDPYLFRHSLNAAYLGTCLAGSDPALRARLRGGLRDTHVACADGLENDHLDLTLLGVAGLLHDLGKVRMLGIVNEQKVYNLDDKTWERIREHPQVAYDLLLSKQLNAEALQGIRGHHENIDGSGYNHLNAGEIHIFARILRVVDSFDAATSRRPAKTPKNPCKLLDELVELSEKHYDPMVAEAFIALVRPCI